MHFFLVGTILLFSFHLRLCYLLFKIHRTPYFLLATNKGKVKVSYTRENYEVLKDLVRINEKNITLEKLERLVKYYITQLK